MTKDDDGPEKPTDDEQTVPIINVEVPRDTAEQAARMADDYRIAIEDALARLTAFDYPTDVLCKCVAETRSSAGK